MIEIEDIIQAYRAARKNKRRSHDQVEFEVHWERNCVQLYHDIINHQVRPTAYTFIARQPKPREVFASDFKTRILHHYIDIRLRPLLEARMSEHTFNNRVGMGTNACQNAVIKDIYEVSKGYTRDAWIIKLDMSGCFPNIVQDIAYKQLEEVILNDYDGADKDELIYMLQVCVFSYPTLHCHRKNSLCDWNKIPSDKSLFNKPIGIGAAIGHLIWQNAVNYYFHEVDEWVLAQNIRYERYVDDMYFVTDNKPAFLVSIIPHVRSMLLSLGACVNEHKFYCQHVCRGCECLGLHIKKRRVYANTRVILRGIRKAKQFNHCIRPSKVYAIMSSLNSYFGICKNVNGYNQAMHILCVVSPKWYQYIHFNDERVCLQANDGYKFNQQIITKYKLNNYDTIRERRSVAYAS